MVTFTPRTWSFRLLVVSQAVFNAALDPLTVSEGHKCDCEVPPTRSCANLYATRQVRHTASFTPHSAITTQNIDPSAVLHVLTFGLIVHECVSQAPAVSHKKPLVAAQHSHCTVLGSYRYLYPPLIDAERCSFLPPFSHWYPTQCCLTTLQHIAVTVDCYIAGSDALLEPGVYTMEDLRIFGRKQRWCPYFLARHMLAFANVVVYNYQYMLDPKVLLIPSHATRHLPHTKSLAGAASPRMHALNMIEQPHVLLSIRCIQPCVAACARCCLSLLFTKALSWQPAHQQPACTDVRSHDASSLLPYARDSLNGASQLLLYSYIDALPCCHAPVLTLHSCCMHATPSEPERLTVR